MKFVLRIAAVVLLAAGVYYFFLRSYEFKVNFTSNTLPGDVIETMRIWNRSLDSAEIIQVDSFDHVRQRLVIKDREYFYDWYFHPDDTTTSVSVQMSEPAHRLLNKWQVVTSEPPIESDGAELVKSFYTILKQHLEITSVKVVGKEMHGPEFCLCRSIEKAQLNKANGMMENYLPMSTSIAESGLTPAGLPSVRLTQWSHNKNKLKYDFCFPIAEADSLPVIEGLEYKHFGSFYALKAEFHGNYITSDRAWYTLYNYAAQNDYKVIGLPVEHFFDNPNFGSNEKEWKAEIFLPIENK